MKLENLSRVTVVVGAYGSGKSEVSVNFAFWLRSQGLTVTLCDLDIINPYFRSSDARKTVADFGIRLIAPRFAGTNVDVPAVPAAVQSVFDDRSGHAVLDIGGETMGIRIVSSLRPHLMAVDPPPSIWMVVNPFRPFTQTADQIIQQAEALGEAAGLPLTGLVHNPNLLENSDSSLLTEQYPLLEGVAERLNLPIVMATAMAEHVPDSWGDVTPEGVPLLRMRKFIRYEKSGCGLNGPC